MQVYCDWSPVIRQPWRLEHLSPLGFPARYVVSALFAIPQDTETFNCPYLEELYVTTWNFWSLEDMAPLQQVINVRGTGSGGNVIPSPIRKIVIKKNNPTPWLSGVYELVGKWPSCGVREIELRSGDVTSYLWTGMDSWGRRMNGITVRGIVDYNQYEISVEVAVLSMHTSSVLFFVAIQFFGFQLSHQEN